MLSPIHPAGKSIDDNKYNIKLVLLHTKILICKFVISTVSTTPLNYYFLVGF